ncbi:MAG: ferredoxin, partial [Tannerella sp.]|nr:ferredoxin [Tannerella sp.]
MILNERKIRHAHLIDAVRQMMTAARTAPKGKGLDIIEIAAVTEDDIRVLSAKTRELGEQNGLKFFLRDAENILSAEAVVLIGTYRQTHGLNCAHCGFPTCGAKPEATPCTLNTVDVGIAIGSA